MWLIKLKLLKRWSLNNSKDDKGADATRLPGFNPKAFLDES